MRLHADDDFKRFKLLHTNIENAIIWKCTTDSESLDKARIVSELWIGNDLNDSTVSKCKFSEFSQSHNYLSNATERSIYDVYFIMIYVTFGSNIGEELLYGHVESQLQR